MQFPETLGQRWRRGAVKAPGEHITERPLQAELFSVPQLERHARMMAGWHLLIAPNSSRQAQPRGTSGATKQTTRQAHVPKSDGLLARLRDNEAMFRDAYTLLSETVISGRQLTPAAEWFIDNYHIIDEQARIARRHLPRSYSRELPRLANARVPGTARVYDLALELISHSHGRVDGEALRAYVGAYQAVQPLKLGELWAIPIMLRLALLENLRRVIAAVTAGRNERTRAGHWMAEMLSASIGDPTRVVLVLADMVEAGEPLTTAFVAELASRLQAQGPSLQFAMTWLEQRIAAEGKTLDHVFHLASQSQAADQVSVSNSIGSLRYLGATDWRDFVEAVSTVEATLRQDPSRVYATMDFATRDRYRHVVEAIARGCVDSDHAEDDVARAVIRIAGGEHIGRWLIGDGRRALEQAVGMRSSLRLRVRRGLHRARAGLYAGALVVTTGLVIAVAATLATAPTGWGGLVLWWGLVALCASQLAVAIVNTAATLLVGPTPLPRLDFITGTGGIPATDATVVAVPAMLSDVAEIDDLVEALEVRYLGNRDVNLSFALLTDFRDAASATTDADAALLAHARAAIGALNTKYALPGGGFYLFHRARVWSAGEGVWMGWERKRGKLEDFNRALRGDSDGFASVVGDATTLAGVRYVIALDSDTALPRDAARLMVGTMAHPLNRPVFDAKLGRVTSGYGILQPRVEVSLESTARTRFARLFAGEPGIDPYTRAVSDVYQDLFQEGSFVGKGIYDVDAVGLALAGRLPENRVLSHDLLEGAFARSGLVSDVVLVEDFPASHMADVSRRTRWIRGDWQIAAWLRRRVPGGALRSRIRHAGEAMASGEQPEISDRVPNPLTLLSQWKILDNLRRSIMPISLVALLLAGWARPDAAAFATLAVATLLILPGVLAAISALWRRPDEQKRWAHVREIGRGAARQAMREAFGVAALPYDAWRALDAIMRTFFRLLFTHRHLLAWRTASDAQRAAQVGLVRSYVALWEAPVLALAVGLTLAYESPATLPWAAPVLALWLAMPVLSWWSSRPLATPQARLSRADLLFLRGVARRTWRFFETFVSAVDHFLPPDNFQEDPDVGIAHRTSPTNIGLSLTANLAAFDFGYLTAGRLIARTGLTLDSLERLQRHRGHFYNWYDTRTLEPLLPTYISTVDSGNLAGHLLTLASGLDQLPAGPGLGPQLLAGLSDTLVACDTATLAWPEARPLVERLTLALANPAPEWRPLLERLVPDARALIDAIAAHDKTQPSAEVVEARWWARAFLASCEEALAELTMVANANFVAQRKEEVRLLAARCRALADFEYGFLYDAGRHLLSVGYSVAEHRLDTSNYDLLASEARLASYIAIAQGKLPQEHWFSLGRQLTATAGRPTLLSWSGSMFEYLMPLLVMPSFPRTLLDETCHAVVKRQIAYGKELRLPWGVSESGYYKTDASLNYQYRAFGVPGLGFKRGLSNDRVVTPYASALALMVAPEAACANLRALNGAGQLGSFGFYEALDCTPARMPPGKDCATVRSYMAHHQGMIFLSLVHLLCERPMQRRFEADPAFRATELLLQERVPRVTTIYPRPPELAAPAAAPDDADHGLRVFGTPNTAGPEVHLLSNGNYHVVVTNAGGGYSRWRDLAVTRWHEDPTRDCWGTFGYLRDVASGAFWSLAHQPTLRPATSYEAIFAQGRVEFRRLDGEIYTHVEISVSPEDDVEVRRVSLSNRGRTRRTIELTSYAEVVLAKAAADASHPAFSNLFVETELVHDQEAIVVTRRARSGDERPPWLIHHVTVDGTTSGPITYETSREAFLGRGRTPTDPLAMHRAQLGDSAGAVLDPIVAIRRVVVLEPHETARIHVVTGISETRSDAIGLLEKYRDRHSAERVFELSWTHSQVLQRRLEASNLDIQLYERLASLVVYTSSVLRASRSLIARNRSGQSGLWAYGISGDLPIVLVRIVDSAGLDLVRQLVKAHAYWRLKGVSADLVVWIEDPTGYRQLLMDEITAAVGRVSDPSWLDKPGGIFVRRSEQISEEDKILMQTVARVIVSDLAGTLSEQIERSAERSRPPEEDQTAWAPDPVTPDEAGPPPALASRTDLSAFNGLGGFTTDGKEYVITTTRDQRTPAPWVNVLANPYFGSVVSESGSAYTWCENAHSYRLTPWSNDAVSDGSGEAIYLRDEESGRFWTPTPLPAGGAGPYTTRHGFGYTIFEAVESGLTTQLTTFVATDAPLKFLVLSLRNRSGRARRISLMAVFELVLGESRAGNMPYVVTELDSKTAGLFARNAFNGAFAQRVAFLDCSEERRTVSGDRSEIFGRNGTAARPASLRRTRLSGRVGAALDPCLAMQLSVALADGEEKEVAFTFGSGRDLVDARTLVSRFHGIGAAHSALEGVWAQWNHLLGAVHVVTPDPALNFLANGWLVYQTLAARMWGRSGFYQSGGAFGFRDQLQDAMALLHTAPGLLREQLLRCAARQFREGDVQHWWHPPEGRGVRTHISDDFLWLPHALCRYVAAIGDTGVMDEKIGFLDGRAVKLEEESYYDLPARSEEVGTLYDHCVRAIRHGLRFGVHGLPLMGSGDWNDGMNLVGAGGKGESVWLGFFLHDVLVRFALIARARGDSIFADVCTTEATLLATHIEANGWDGGWYRRAYFDSGEPLGSMQNAECQIDSLPQSWAVLSHAGDPVRARMALAAVDERLVRRDIGVIQLFDPPFDTSDLKPGYVKGYLPGVRENGGQYTHAAVWTVMAFAAAGDVDRAWELFSLINPVRHGDSDKTIATYRVEPYVVAADVYVNPQHAGRGGWTWYTGSAGWMYRLIIESLLGIALEVERMRFAPLLPAAWPGFDVHYRYRTTVYHIHVANLGGGGRAVRKVVLDGGVQADASIPLVDDGREHRVVVEVGG